MSYYLMHRGWMENDAFCGEPYDNRSAWCWLIENAAWEASVVRIERTLVELQRGEVSASEKHLAETWKWSKSRVHRFLADLTAFGMITRKSSPTRGTQPEPSCEPSLNRVTNRDANRPQAIITICKYDKYQINGKFPEPSLELIAAENRTEMRTKEERKKEDIKGSDSPNGESASFSNGNGADPVKALWDRGKSLLRAVNVPEKQIGSLIGKWRKEFGDAAVMAAITAAEEEAASDPVSFMAACLARSRRMSRQPTFGAPGFG